VVATGDRESFTAIGTIEEAETGRPLPNLVVRAYDRDMVFDDRVGLATSDEDGRFQIRFHRRNFGDVWESQPDLYLCNFDPPGTRELYHTRDSIRWNASAHETYRPRIPARALRPLGSR
jgi:hypothetical protein